MTFSDIKIPKEYNIEKSAYTYNLDYLSATTTYPFGARIDSLSFESPSYRFGFTGHLKDNNIRPEKGDGSNYSTLFREYDPIIGRWWSVDPDRELSLSSSPFCSYNNNPISYTDPEGNTTGDYYNTSGSYLGSDNKNDNKAYVAEGVTKASDNEGNERLIFKNPKELSMINSKLNTISNIISHEGQTKDPLEYLWIAHTGNNGARESKMSLFTAFMSTYSTVPNKFKIPMKNNTSISKDLFARSAVINVLTGGKDVTGGATLWDGVDFLAWGLNSYNGTPQNKFEEYKSIYIEGDIYQKYLNNILSFRTYENGKYNYQGKSWSIPASVFKDKNNWSNGNFFYETGAKMPFGLKAVGTFGNTIYWKKVK